MMAATHRPPKWRNVPRLADGAPDMVWNRPLARGVESCSDCLLKSANSLKNSKFEAHFEVHCPHSRLLTGEGMFHQTLDGPRLKSSCAINGSIFAAREDIMLLFSFVEEHQASLDAISTSVKWLKTVLHEVLCKTLEVESDFSKQLYNMSPAARDKDLARRLDLFRLRGPFPYDGDMMEKRAWHLAGLPRLLPTDIPDNELRWAMDNLALHKRWFLRSAAKVLSKSARDQMSSERLLSQELRLRDERRVEHASGNQARRDEGSAMKRHGNATRKPGTSAKAGDGAHRVSKEKPGRPTAYGRKVKPDGRTPTDLSTDLFANRKRKTVHPTTDKPGRHNNPKRIALGTGVSPTTPSRSYSSKQDKKDTLLNFKFHAVPKASLSQRPNRKHWRPPYSPTFIPKTRS